MNPQQNYGGQQQNYGGPPQQQYGGGPPQDWKAQGADKKIAAGICGILLGGFGVHKFVLGYQNEGAIMLGAYIVGWVIAFVTCGIGVFIPLAVNIIGLVEGIMYLTKSDQEFVQNYIQRKKPWF